ncbi:hypothetical protein ElyMa_002476900 [Elysia marginata]|uniref:Peptidase M13 N-terminal domain-containing protein n=1 Tax=Elysia marginata TaxID=1093978 RepID=A0AAV4GM70_9GAST|nr:hypothetical protein ElyMa_002476900 [Elysia marginata]
MILYSLFISCSANGGKKEVFRRTCKMRHCTRMRVKDQIATSAKESLSCEKSIYSLHQMVEPIVPISIYYDFTQERDSTVLAVYETLLREMAIELGADPSVAAQDAKDFVDLKIELSKLSRVYFSEFNVTLSELSSSANYTWLGLPQAITTLFNSANMTLGANEKIIIHDKLGVKSLDTIKELLENKTERRWRLFGYILRRDIEIPANKSMEEYFVREGGKFLEKPITTLPNVLNKDLSRLPTGELRLKTNEDLDHLRSIAQDRQQWKGLTTKIREAAEASRSED